MSQGFRLPRKKPTGTDQDSLTSPLFAGLPPTADLLAMHDDSAPPAPLLEPSFGHHIAQIPAQDPNAPQPDQSWLDGANALPPFTLRRPDQPWLDDATAPPPFTLPRPDQPWLEESGSASASELAELGGNTVPAYPDRYLVTLDTTPPGAENALEPAPNSALQDSETEIAAAPLTDSSAVASSPITTTPEAGTNLSTPSSEPAADVSGIAANPIPPAGGTDLDLPQPILAMTAAIPDPTHLAGQNAAVAQQTVAQLEQDISRTQAEMAALLAEDAATALPDLATLLEPGPDGELPAIPELALLEPVTLDWSAKTPQAQMPSTPALETFAQPSPSLVGTESPASITSEVPLLIQRQATPGAEDIDSADLSDDDDPLVARQQVQSMASVLSDAPTQVQQQLQAQAVSAGMSIQTNAQAVQQTIEASLLQQISDLQESFVQRRTGLQEACTTVQTQVDELLQSSTAEATQKGDNAKSRLRGIFTSHRTQLEQTISAYTERVGTMTTERQAEARRRLQAKAAEARQRGEARATSFPGDERGQKQAAAVRQVAASVAQEIEEQIPEVNQAITGITSDIPAQIREQGQAALQQYDERLPALLQGIDEQVHTVINALQQHIGVMRAQIQQIGNQLAGQLAAQEQQTTSAIQGLLPNVAAQVQSIGQIVTPTLNAAAQQASSQIGQFVNQAGQTLLGIENPDVDAAQNFIDQVSGFASAATADVSDSFQAVLGPIGEQLGLVQTNVEAAAQSFQTNAAAQLQSLDEGIQRGFTDLLTSTSTGIQDMLVGLDEPFSNVETETETGFTTALQDLCTGFDSTLATADGEITKAIDAGVAHADAALHRLDGKMDEAAAEAAWRHDHPVLATLRDIGGFIAGLVVGIVAAVALVVVAIVAFKVIVAGLVALGLSMAVASAVAVLAGLGLLLFGIYQAHQERVRNGEADNWATWGHALLDVFGVTGLINAFTSPDLSPYERGLAIGWFAGEIAATFFGGRLHKLISARLPSRIRNPVRGSLWRRQQAPRLTEANDPTPRLRAASDDPAVDTDAIKPQQARVLTSIDELMADPSKIHGSSVKDVAEFLTRNGVNFTIKPTTGSVQTGTVFVITPGQKTNITQIQWHPGGGRHRGSYWKISTSDRGRIKVVDSNYVVEPGENAIIIRVGE